MAQKKQKKILINYELKFFLFLFLKFFSFLVSKKLEWIFPIPVFFNFWTKVFYWMVSKMPICQMCFSVFSSIRFPSDKTFMPVIFAMKTASWSPNNQWNIFPNAYLTHWRPMLTHCYKRAQTESILTIIKVIKFSSHARLAPWQNPYRKISEATFWAKLLRFN